MRAHNSTKAPLKWTVNVIIPIIIPSYKQKIKCIYQLVQLAVITPDCRAKKWVLTRFENPHWWFCFVCLFCFLRILPFVNYVFIISLIWSTNIYVFFLILGLEFLLAYSYLIRMLNCCMQYSNRQYYEWQSKLFSIFCRIRWIRSIRKRSTKSTSSLLGLLLSHGNWAVLPAMFSILQAVDVNDKNSAGRLSEIDLAPREHQ